MPLVKNGKIATDIYVHVADDAELPSDGAVLVSSPDKNPTLSIIALAWRSSDHLATLAKQGAL